MKQKIYTTILFVFLTFFSTHSQGVIDPTTAPYYGTASYPYWGKYIKTPFNMVTPTQWSNTDGVVIGWDWSLPTFVKIPKKSTFSLLRNSGLNQTKLKALTKPNFVCNPTVAHWIKWSDLEATKDNFTFSGLIENIKLCYSKGYSSIIRIHSSATTFAPAWVGSDIGAPILPKETGADVQNYDVADPRFHARYLKLVEAIGKSGIPHMKEVAGLYVGYASKSNGDEGIGPVHNSLTGNDNIQHVRERLDAWANITVGVREKVFMGGPSNYGMSKGFGIRRGWVEMYLYNIPNSDFGQLVDANKYLYVDETNPIVAKNLFHGEENEEYDEKWATAENGNRFGTSTESFPYRFFTSNLRLLQMRCNEVLNYEQTLIPEMTAWVGQELGCTVDEAPDVWSFLRESYLKTGGGTPVKNFERWLYQRDAPGYTTVPAVKIDQSIQMWMVQVGKYYDYVAREGKKIGFNIDKNWTGINGQLAFKVSVFDNYSGTLNLNYSNGSKIVTLSKPLNGDGLLKTYTFFVSDYKNGANIGGKFDFTIESGDANSNIVVSFVRVVQAQEGVSLSTDEVKNISNSNVSIFPNPTSGFLNIYFPEGNNTREVKVFNMLGQLVHSLKTSLSSIQIDVQSLNIKGNVILQVSDGNQISKHKVILK